MKNNEYIEAIANEIKKFGNATDGRIFLEIEHREIPGLLRGNKYDVSFRIKNRRYNAFLFCFYIRYEPSGVDIIWGEKEISCKTTQEVQREVKSILEYPNVIRSREQLLTLYEESDRRGTVKTIDFDTLAGNDFDVSISTEEYLKLESAYNQGDIQIEILVKPTKHSILPGRYVDQIKSQYRFLEFDGMRAYIDDIHQETSDREPLILKLKIADVH